jgi:hypothetical protein
MVKPVKTWLPAFLRFIEMVRITSKESEGLVPIVPYEGQKRFLREVTEGLNDDIHHFTVLKSRQLGISTILLALDIFWLYMHDGLQGALITDSATNLETFRQTISEMLESLPPRYSVPILRHNRNGLVLANGSRLQYMSAGKQKNSGLGRSRALNYVHATECSSWGDQKGLDSLRHALAEINPSRLYIFESTALGYNIFENMWRDAKADPRQKAIFIGWWSKDTQRVEAGSIEYETFWATSPHLTEEEAEVEERVLKEYGWQITPEQWAWYRYRLSLAPDEASFLEEQPSTEEEAFQATGNGFFNLKKVKVDLDFIARGGVGYRGYQYTLGKSFLKMKTEETRIPDDVDLRVWEDPVKDAKYVIGVDPAYGADEDRDRSTIEVWRCYSDKMVQVAEYNTPIPNTRQVAWVMAHLAGCYRDCMINLEITGPGGEVMNELDNLRMQIQYGQLRELAPSLNPGWALDQARWYLYHRPDTMGTGYAYGFKTGYESKQRILNRMRDEYEGENLIVRSVLLLDEMTHFVQDGGKLHASGRYKDDRVMATALANFAWSEWVRAGMMIQGRTFETEQKKDQEKSLKGGTVISWIVPLHFENAAKQRAEADLQRYLET